jgi:hypothetical protein
MALWWAIADLSVEGGEPVAPFGEIGIAAGMIPVEEALARSQPAADTT